MASYDKYRDEFEEAFRYAVACLPFYSILTIMAGVLGLMMLCSVRQKKDPARSYLNWLRCAFTLFTFYGCMQVIVSALYAANMRLYLDSHGYASASTRIVSRVSRYVGFVYVVAGTFTEILLFLTLVSICICVSESRRGIISSGVKVIRVVAFVISFIVGILAIARFALACRTETLTSGLSNYRSRTDINRLQFTISVFMVWLALVVSCWSVVIKSKAKAVQQPDTPSTYLLVCSVLFLLHAAYELGLLARYVNLDNSALNSDVDLYVTILDMIFSFFPIFIIFFILFALSRKQADGLWSLPGVGYNSNMPAMVQQTPWGPPQMQIQPQYQPYSAPANPVWNQQQFTAVSSAQLGPSLSPPPPQATYGQAQVWHEMPQPAYREHTGTKLSG